MTPAYFQALLGDFAFAWRRLRASPGFMAVAVGTVALGIGSATAVYSVASAVVFRPLPYQAEEELAWVWSTRPDRDRAFFSIPDFLDLKRAATTTAGFAAITPIGVNFTGLGEPERVLGWRVTPDLFSLLGVQAEVGRLPTPTDNVANVAPVAIIGYAYWQRRFGGDPTVVGRVITLNGAPHTVVGVVPRTFIIPNSENDIFIAQSLESNPRRDDRGTNFLRGIARLKPGVSLSQAQEEFTELTRRLGQLYPDTNALITAPRFVALRDEVVGSYRASLWLLLGASSALIAIMCANLAGLLAARGLARERDAALCSALGASQSRLLRMYLAEGFVIALLGGGLGIAACAIGLPGLLSLAPVDLPRAGLVELDQHVIGIAIACTLLTALGIGVAPALRLARTAPGDILKSRAGGTRPATARKVLVAVQIALCTVLLIGTGLFARSLSVLLTANAGFAPAGVLTAQALVPAGSYRDVGAVVRFVDEAMRRQRSLEGSQNVSVTSVLPLTGINTRSEFTRGDRPSAKPTDSLSAANRFIAENYFATVGIPLLAGRDFRIDDDVGHPSVVIIDHALAQQHWLGENPLGKTIQIRDGMSPKPRDLEIIGVVGPTKNFTLEERGTPTLYLPFRQMVPANVPFFIGRIIFVLKTAGDPLALGESVRREIRAVEPNAALSLRSLEEAVAWARAPRIFNLRLLGFFSVVAVLLCVIGTYAITAQTVAARTREIGIRLALGAEPVGMTRHIVVSGARLAFGGVVAGLALAAGLSHLLARMLYGVHTIDLATYSAVVVALSTVILVATWLPARRAARISPTVALRAY